MRSNEIIEAVFEKTDGACRYCDKQIVFNNYGVYGRRGAWQVDHSVSKANGGTDHLNNLFPACIDCNQEKGPRNGASYIRWRRERNLHVPTRENPGFLDWLFG
jgi:5-methylcytosine-specific restriction endonuclease McrA